MRMALSFLMSLSNLVAAGLSRVNGVRSAESDFLNEKVRELAEVMHRGVQFHPSLGLGGYEDVPTFFGNVVLSPVVGRVPPFAEKYTQDDFIRMEVIALNAASKVFIYGLDRPVMFSRQYVDAFRESVFNRGIELRMVADAGSNEELFRHLGLSPCYGTEVAPAFADITFGSRLYQNRVFSFLVDFDSNNKSGFEENVFFRTFRFIRPSYNLLLEVRSDIARLGNMASTHFPTPVR